MLLNIGERLHLLVNVAPAEGRMSAIRLVRKFREELSVHPDEMAKVEFREEAGMVRWNPALDTGKEIETGEFIDKMILKTLDKMEKENKLREEFIGLYERLGFVSSDN